MLEYASFIKRISNLPMDVHLMVEDIKKSVEEFSVVEPNIITFHLEACKNKEEVLEIIKYIKNNNVKVGIAVKPKTKIEKIYEYIPLIHEVLVMTVEPGKGGQKLIPETVDKVTKLKKYIEKNNLDTYIEVDGGVNKDTIDLVKNAGADIAVAGSAIISAEDFKTAIDELKK